MAKKYVRDNIDETRERILEATIKVFNRKGLKFTMDDIATELGISKKTIYAVFKDKESMFFCMVDYCFDKINAHKEMVLQDESLSTVDRVREVLSMLPDGYRDVEERLETGWEGILSLIDKGIEEGSIRPVNVYILKTMMEATLEQFFQRDVLVKNKISYNDALNEVVNILVDGIAIK